MVIKADDFMPADDVLTADERAALEEGAAEDVAAVAAAKDDAADAADPDVEYVDAGAKITPADAKAELKAEKAEDTAKVEDKAEAEAEAEVKADTTETTAADEPAPRERIVPQVPSDADAKLAALEAKREALADKFDAGEITAKDLFKETGALDREARQIERLVERAEFHAEATKATWLNSSVPAFLDAHPHYNDAGLQAQLDAQVRQMQTKAIAEGKDQFNPGILVAADKALKESMAKLLGMKLPETVAPAKADGKGVKRTGDVLPPTLATVPAADIASTDSKYAHLDRLQGVAFEDAFAKLPEAEREAFLNATH